jgi:lysophospholipase L1-like esterase
MLIKTLIDAASNKRHSLCMKLATLRAILASFITISSLQWTLLAQTNFPASATAINEPRVHTNTALLSAPRTDWGVPRQTLVLKRAKEAHGDYDIEFIGDSITEAWEGAGTNIWREYYGKRKAINFGVSGDRTQHVLWRLENGQLDGIKSRVAVLMIGTNNSLGQDNTEAEILEGITAIVQQMRIRQPDTKIILLGIFPRGESFSTQRGKILQVNEALAKLDDGMSILYIDFGFQLIERDGSISKAIMPDYLHLTEAGYRIWANAIESKLKRLLGE